MALDARRIKKNRSLSRSQTAILLAAPAFLFTFVLLLYPILRVFWESVRNANLMYPHLNNFIGLDNFRYILADPYFWTALKNTLLLAVIAVPIQLVIGLAIALALNEPLKGRGIFRTLFLLPWVTPPVVASLIWAWLLNDSFGVINYLFVKLGFLAENHLWLGEASTALASIIAVDTWRETPFFILMLLAGLQSVPLELYEAAKIDGAGWFRQLRSITLPLLRPAILVSLLIRTMSSFKIFDLIYTLTGGGPGGMTEVLATMTYKTTFAYMRIGRGSALAVIIFAIVIAISLLYVRFLGGAEDGA